MRILTPLLIAALVAGHALAGSGSATADHAPVVTVERVATVALALLLVLGLARLHRSH